MYEKILDWYTIELLKCHDDHFNKNSFLSLNLMINYNEELKKFSQLYLNFYLNSDNKNKFINIDNVTLTFLFKSLKEIINIGKETICKNKSFLSKKIGNKYLNIKFIYDQNINSYLVEIYILYSENDFIKITLSYDSFIPIVMKIKEINDNFSIIHINLINSYLFFKNLEHTNEINKNIQIFLSEINNKNINDIDIPNFNEDDNIHSNEEIEDIINTNKELEFAFNNTPFNENEFYVGIETQPQKNKIFSKIKNDWLKNDITNIMKKINILYISKNPLDDFYKDFHKILEINSFFPDITKEDMNSILYISNLLFIFSVEALKENKLNNIPIITYKPIKENFKLDNEYFEVFTDLLLIHAYLRGMKNRLNDKIENLNDNFSACFNFTRILTDPIIYSFLPYYDANQIKSILINKYHEYSKEGFFISTEKYFKDYNISKIEDIDITMFITELYEKILPNISNVKSMYNKYFNSGILSIPYDNILEINDYIKEIISLELNFYKGNFNILENIKDKLPNIILKNFKRKIPKEENDYKNNIERYIYSIKDKIPYDKFEIILNILENLNENKIEIPDNLDLTEFSEEVIKGLFLWKPDEDAKILKNYNYFLELIENEPRDKNLLISLMKNKNQTTDDDWNFI